MAEIIREISGNRANRMEPRALIKALKGLVSEEHGKLDIREVIALSHRERAEHQRADHTLVPLTRLAKALYDCLLKHALPALPFTFFLSNCITGIIKAEP